MFRHASSLMGSCIGIAPHVGRLFSRRYAQPDTAPITDFISGIPSRWPGSSLMGMHYAGVGFLAQAASLMGVLITLAWCYGCTLVASLSGLYM